MSVLVALALISAAPAKREVGVGEARKTMMAFAACLQNRAGFKLRKILDLPVGAKATRDRWRSLLDEGCLDIEGTLRFQPNVMRGAFYEIIYRMDFGKFPAVVTFDDVAPIAYPVSQEDQYRDGAKYRLEMEVGDCMVRADPAAARTLILTDVESDQETASIKALVPVVSKCMDAGRTVTLSTSIMRGLAAEALYRLSVAKRNAPHA
ncbi:hypothetical protein [Sphingomonas sp. DC1600-2]|uniref:hypothetical protein n=1 Tax=unclassified Sphingomonas TaxID=196159 RepID=UPI003CF51EE0